MFNLLGRIVGKNRLPLTTAVVAAALIQARSSARVMQHKNQGRALSQAARPFIIFVDANVNNNTMILLCVILFLVHTAGRHYAVDEASCCPERCYTSAYRDNEHCYTLMKICLGCMRCTRESHFYTTRALLSSTSRLFARDGERT